MDLRKVISDWHSRMFGTWSLDDPRPIAANAPYTFYLPSQRRLDAVRPGDFVKAIFRPSPSNRIYDAERMWVLVTDLRDGEICGMLDNDPTDLPQLKAGSSVRIPFSRIIDIQWADDHDGPTELPVREYWDRCMADDCVANGRSIVDYLYREEPDLGTQDDRFPDSGWRLRGTEAEITRDEAAEVKPHYLALGAVLNQDDRWIHLIDAPIGAQFRWNEASGAYVSVTST